MIYRHPHLVLSTKSKKIFGLLSRSLGYPTNAFLYFSNAGSCAHTNLIIY